jgi:shikimate kinase
MHENGLVIYLKLTPEQLENRLSASSTVRPLLWNVERSGLGKYIREKLGEREKWYQQADIVVDGSETDIPRLCALAAEWLRK